MQNKNAHQLWKGLLITIFILVLIVASLLFKGCRLEQELKEEKKNVEQNAGSEDQSLTPTTAGEKAPEVTAADEPTNTPEETPTKVPAAQTPDGTQGETPAENPDGAQGEASDKDPTAIPSQAAADSSDANPTNTPTAAAANTPTTAVTKAPTAAVTKAPTTAVTKAPTAAATKAPTTAPTKKPTAAPTKKPTAAPTKKPTATPTKAPTTSKGTPLAQHGKLSVKGTNIVDKNGKVFQLKGVSTHGLQWFPEYVNKQTFQTLRDEWGANVVRLAMYTAESGYCVTNDAGRTKLKNLVKNGVQYATDLGMYVIIDWHILHDNNPNTYKSQSIAFFKEMAKTYADHDNVIYEICNEPNGGTTWSQITSYAKDVIAAIRTYDKDAIIVVGTPNWSQLVDQAAAKPITGQKNIMYTLHFYAGTHKDDLRNKMINAIKAGLPIFVTEFGICDASGNGALDEASANKWMKLMNEYSISYCCWNLSNKNESSSLIKSGVKKVYGWKQSEISGEGLWLIKAMKGTLSELGSIDVDQIIEQAGNSGNTGNTGGNTPAALPAAVSYTGKSGNCDVSLKTGNTWNEEGKSCYQFELTMKNATSADMKNWKLVITFNQNVTCSNGWCGKITCSGKTMTVLPESTEAWSSTIAAGGTNSSIGFIVSSGSGLKITKIELTHD